MQLIDWILLHAVNFIPVLLSLTVHEWAHAWTAWKLGDDTAKMLGRVSLNPLDHIDPVGTLLLPLLGIPFGWAKPVPFNPTRFHRQVSMPMGVLLVAAAGPISNLLLAASCLGGLFMMTLFNGNAISVLDPRFMVVHQLLQQLVVINCMLAFFNLLPIPPLDGSQIVGSIIPDRLRAGWNSFASIGPLVLISVVVILPAVIGFSILSWPLSWVSQLLEWVTS
jgi:Zn-dependent protease